jgi:Na+/H+ antiporter NhaD/arsenite permease-like protein
MVGVIMDQTQLVALIIFGITYLGIIFTRLPGVNVDRPSAAFSGAIAMVLFGVLTPEEAITAIDANTILLLLGMMIIIATLQLDGFFTLIARYTIAYSKTRLRLLILIVFVTGIVSAFLVNDAVVLMFTPVIIQICLSSKLNPLPFLIGEILASNAGSLMTMTGNPQNMLIGMASGIPYGTFMLKMLPVSLFSLLIIVAVLRLVYRDTFRVNVPLEFSSAQPALPAVHMGRSAFVFIVVLIGFFTCRYSGLSIPLVALTGAALILLLGKAKPSEIIHQVDWVLLLFFASLFIVVAAVEKTGVLDSILSKGVLTADFKGVSFLHGLSLILAQVLSNVPYVILMVPFLKTAGSELLWLALAASSTLSGNATIIGAMANLIVIETAGRQGVRIGFRTFFASGILVTALRLGLSLGWLYFLQQMGLVH